MRLGGSAPSRILPKYLRSDMEYGSVDWLCWVAVAPPPAGGARLEKISVCYCAVPRADAKPQRHRNAGVDMHPLRFGVSAEIIGERRATAVVKDKKPRVCKARGLER